MNTPITTKSDQETDKIPESTRDGVSWAPTQSLITVTVQPIYSRREIEQFSLQKYVNGDYVKSGGGFI